jgi:hypothetical protein
MELITYCVDVGAISRNFAWARVESGEDRFDPAASADIKALTGSLAADLETHRRTALGFEAPIFVPVPLAPEALGKQRMGDRGRPWSAGPGGTVLPTGIVQVAWVLRELRSRVGATPRAYLSWEDFANSEDGLFLWEAFVSHKTAASEHYEDALAGARRFAEVVAHSNPATESAVVENEDWLSLVGAALLWAGWTTDLAVLHRPVPVISATVAA